MATTPVSLAQFGQRIKAKYPEYSDLADEDLGQRVLTKYPQYSDMVLPGVPKAPQVEMKKLGALDAGGGWSPDDLLRGAVSGVKNMVAHPLQTGAGMGQAFTASGVNPGGMYPTTAATGRQADSQANTAVQNDAQQDQAQQAKFIGQNPAYAVGSVAGPALVTAGLTKAIKVGAPVLGDAMQGFAESNLNQKMNVGTRDTLYGQNPGRGILRSGIGTSTRNGLIEKVAGAKDANGALISNAIQRADANANAPQITPQQLRPLIEGPIESQRSVVQGPGNHVANAETPLDVALSKYTQPAPGATTSIYGPNAPSTILPSDLWKTIQNVDRNTRFNPQPEVETLNEVGRDIRGGLRGHLETTDPSIKPSSQNYSDLSSAQTALERQGAPYYQPHGLRSLAADTINSYPVRTAISSGLYKTGGALKSLFGTPAMGSAGAVFSPKMTGKPLQLESSVPANAEYGADFSQGGYAARPPITPAAPQSLFQLPASTTPGEPQPMIGVKAPAPYPPLAEDYARTRVKPTQFAGPPTNPMGHPKGFLNAVNPPKPKAVKK